MAVGIIAEYNPFHAGHAHQIAQIKNFSDAEIVAVMSGQRDETSNLANRSTFQRCEGTEIVAVMSGQRDEASNLANRLTFQRCEGTEIVVVMSGDFTQRGEPAILDKWTRAKLAVSNGVDLVLELPFLSAVRSAQDFARGGIRLLESLGVVDTLAFGAEVTDLSALKRAAETFDEKFFADELHALMSTGTSYAHAVTKILANVTALDEKLLRQPNTILAIEYLRALPEKISPLLIARHGAAYDDSTLHEKFSSASAIRKAIREPSPPWQKISAQVDAETLTELREEKLSGLVDEEFLFRPLLTKLLTATAVDLRKIYGMTEGLEFRLLKAASQAESLSELVTLVVGRRFTASRVRRLILHTLLDVTGELVAEADGATCAKVLAFNERGRHLLKKISAPVVTKLTKHLTRRDLTEGTRPLLPYQKILRTDVLASDLRAILFDVPKPRRTDFTTSPTTKVTGRHG